MTCTKRRQCLCEHTEKLRKENKRKGKEKRGEEEERLRRT
jgi:hypothetical protein